MAKEFIQIDHSPHISKKEADAILEPHREVIEGLLEKAFRAQKKGERPVYSGGDFYFSLTNQIV